MKTSNVVSPNTTAVSNAAQSNEGFIAVIATPLGQILISFLGALLAYYAWDYLNRPKLNSDEIISKNIVQKKESSSNQTSHYLRIKNSGSVPATRCRAELRLRGKTEYPEHISEDDKIIAMNLPLGWADMRGNLLVHQREDYSRNARIPAGETVTTHLFRETTGYIMVAEWVDPSGKPLLQLPADEYEIENIGEEIGFNDDSNELEISDQEYEQKRNINYEDFDNTEWKVSEVVVSSDEGSSFRQSLSLEVNTEGNSLRLSIDKNNTNGRFHNLVKQIFGLIF